MSVTLSIDKQLLDKARRLTGLNEKVALARNAPDMNDIVIFQAKNQQVEVRLEGETLLSLQQLADLFGRDRSVISRNLKKYI